MQPELRQKLQLYLQLLTKWQRTINLVAPNTLTQAWERHIEDSLQVVDMIPQNATIADLGSGGGFPGMVIALARPDVTVNLIESDQKKCTFLLVVSRETGAKNVHVYSERIENILPKLPVDVITARALASLGTLLDMCKSQPNAMCIFLKGETWRQEVDLARKDHLFAFDSQPSKTEPSAAILRIMRV